jgi:hypothetical protein
MSILYRGPSIDASYQVLVHSANQKQELPVASIFVNGTGRNEQFYRGPSIDASYQVSVHLAEFQRRRLKCEKLTDDRRRTPSDGKSSNCLWQGELKMSHIIKHSNFRPPVNNTH